MTVHLDTNQLTEIARRSSPFAKNLIPWLEQGNTIATSSIAWSEFCNGPVTAEEKHHVCLALGDNIIDFTRTMAETSSILFNLTGRRRGSHPDCMIAACAILANSPLSTFNTKDFDHFTPHGLILHTF
jgi:predicted nucleic acid-binding protein